jgi:hypothetical protein
MGAVILAARCWAASKFVMNPERSYNAFRRHAPRFGGNAFIPKARRVR